MPSYHPTPLRSIQMKTTLISANSSFRIFFSFLLTDWLWVINGTKLIILWMRSSRVVRASGCQCQSRNSPVPEFIDPVFTKTSPKRSFSLIRKRAFWLVFAKTGSIISGTGCDPSILRDTVESERRQTKQCWIPYIKWRIKKNPPSKNVLNQILVDK